MGIDIIKNEKGNNECKCPHCGSKDFYVHEFEYWKASTDDDGKTINCFHKGCGIDCIECTKCRQNITDYILNSGFTLNFQ